MNTLKILIKKPVYLLLLSVFLLSGTACKQHKCPANGGEIPKPVNKYRPGKPQTGLWDKKTKKRRRR